MWMDLRYAKSGLRAKRELRSVSTDRRSLPKAVARVVPQGLVPAKRKVVLVVFNLKTHV